MTFSYDKLLLGAGALVLLVGVGFYVVNSNEISTARAEIGSPGSHQYEPIPVPDFGENTAVWPNAVEQAPGELYDVFTPPAIWIDKEGTFIFESPIDDLPPIPFGVYLADLENEPYRIQLEGYVEESLSDPKESVLLFYDEENRERVRARVGDSIMEHEFTCLNFTIDRIRDANGNVAKLAVVTLRDHRDGRRVFLTHGKRRYKENTTVVLQSKENPSFRITITEKPPYHFETPTAKYILEKINLEESSVTVKKLENGVSEAESKQLFLNTSEEITKPSQSQSNEPKTNSNTQVFDFEF